MLFYCLVSVALLHAAAATQLKCEDINRYMAGFSSTKANFEGDISTLCDPGPYYGNLCGGKAFNISCSADNKNKRTTCECKEERHVMTEVNYSKTSGSISASAKCCPLSNYVVMDYPYIRDSKISNPENSKVYCGSRKPFKQIQFDYPKGKTIATLTCIDAYDNK